jgi:hypothetical protein
MVQRLRRVGRVVSPPKSTNDDGRIYDAFISYSHAVDGRLAPSLQSALQRFTRPWNRLRALRVFRDQTDLAANPGFWSSIEQALATSRFFIMLASPEAADSKWVARETEYWRRHKQSENVLIVLTSGEIVWDHTTEDFDWNRTSALPSTLQGMFSEEPLYVDLRFASTENDLSLHHPRFRDCIADLAAPIHGRPKAELAGREFRERRRALRLARTAVSLLTLLAIVAGGSSIVAFNQRNEARSQRNEARAQRDRAEKQARLAASRQLAVQSGSDRPDRPDRAMLLSLAAMQIEATPEAQGASWPDSNSHSASALRYPVISAQSPLWPSARMGRPSYQEVPTAMLSCGMANEEARKANFTAAWTFKT